MISVWLSSCLPTDWGTSVNSKDLSWVNRRPGRVVTSGRPLPPSLPLPISFPCLDPQNVALRFNSYGMWTLHTCTCLRIAARGGWSHIHLGEGCWEKDALCSHRGRTRTPVTVDLQFATNRDYVGCRLREKSTLQREQRWKEARFLVVFLSGCWTKPRPTRPNTRLHVHGNHGLPLWLKSD